MRSGFRYRLDRLPDWLQRLIAVGALPTDSEELRVRKSVLVLSTVLMASAATVWVVTYAVLGLWVSAAIPFAYQVASAISLLTFARTRRYVLFRSSQLFLSLMLPFLLQWSLGGFEASSAVCIWGITSPLGALLFLGARQSVPWFVAFAGLVAFSAAIDPALSESPADVPHGVVVAFFALNIIAVAATTYALLQYFVAARERARVALAAQHEALELEQQKSERLLLNVLPAPVAERLKQRDGVIADHFPAVTRPVRRPGRVHAALGAALRGRARLAARPHLRPLGRARRALRGREDQDDRRRLHGRRRDPASACRPRRGGRRDGAARCSPSWSAARRRRGCGCRRGSGSTPARSSPA